MGSSVCERQDGIYCTCGSVVVSTIQTCEQHRHRILAQLPPNVVALLVAIPPTNAEAADRFHTPGEQYIFGTNKEN